MPFKSEAQRKFMFLKKPKIAKEWAEKYRIPKNLPERLIKKLKNKRGGK